ncbi:hypothetical protein [Sphingopyxis sp.]|uniref:hypothetical protein n=1 Tax=Sphingopyxis sp. TaxID=1908224 RepID=UPI0025EDB0B1|nr:hypothetical protein [Sphingopyxis sp.]MBK6414006.1 hypothetical protein [Sphingopyxis sp.]
MRESTIETYLVREVAESYRTAAERIDWSIPCPSIFTRERPLVEATLRRIARAVHLLCARTYIGEAKRRRGQPFAFTLLQWAANARLRAQHEPVQRDLFTDQRQREAA